MFTFGETKLVKETFYGAKKPINELDANVDIVVSKLVETKTNSRHSIE